MLAGVLAVVAAAVVAVAGFYIVNPSGTASRDLGARLWGRATMPVPDRSMEPTLLPGYELEVDAGAYRRQAPRRGDLVAYVSLEGPRVGRVVALPGEQVAIRLGDVFVDGELQPAPEGVTVATGPGPGRDLAETLVPQGQVFVLADNRDLGGDSRDWGPVPAAHWIGKVVAVRR